MKNQDPDLTRAARSLIDFYGKDAAVTAERRALVLPDDGPDSAANACRRISPPRFPE